MNQGPGQLFSVELLSEDGVRVIELTLPALLDSEAFDQLNEQILSTLDQQLGARWVLDLARVSYLGSAMLGLMVNVRQRIKQAGGALVLCGLSDRLMQIFEACCMERLFHITRTRPEAVRLAIRARV